MRPREAVPPAGAGCVVVFTQRDESAAPRRARPFLKSNPSPRSSPACSRQGELPTPSPRCRRGTARDGPVVRARTGARPAHKPSHTGGSRSPPWGGCGEPERWLSSWEACFCYAPGTGASSHSDNPPALTSRAQCLKLPRASDREDASISLSSPATPPGNPGGGRDRAEGAERGGAENPRLQSPFMAEFRTPGRMTSSGCAPAARCETAQRTQLARPACPRPRRQRAGVAA